jgi:hypothetical protein
MLRSVLFVSVALSAAMASSDMTVKTVTSVEDNRPNSSGTLAKSRTVHLETLFVQGNKLRRESLDPVEPGLPDFSFGRPRLITIDHCDKGLQFLVNPITHQYIRHKTKAWHHRVFVRTHHSTSTKAAKPAAADNKTYSSLSSETEDTGETREMFGLTARHFITRTTRMPIGGVGPQEDIADGWFVKKAIVPSGCAPGALPGAAGLSQVDAARPLGLPVQVKYQSNSPIAGPAQQQPTLETLVIELSEQAVDSRLFKVPKGYKRVRHFRSELKPERLAAPEPLR